MDRGTWQATIPGVAKSRTRLSTHTGKNLKEEVSVHVSGRGFLWWSHFKRKGTQHLRRKPSGRKDEQADAEKQRSVVLQVFSDSRDRQLGLLNVIHRWRHCAGGWGVAAGTPRHGADVQGFRLSLPLDAIRPLCHSENQTCPHIFKYTPVAVPPAASLECRVSSGVVMKRKKSQPQ